MATVHYLNWDTGPGRDADTESEESEFFQEAHFLMDEDIDPVPRSLYRRVAEVPDTNIESIWTAFQGGVPSDCSDETVQEVKRVFEKINERSMSVGDVIEINDEKYIAVSIGFEEITWKHEE